MYIGMPEERWGEKCPQIRAPFACVNYVYVFETFASRYTSGRVFMQLTKVLPELPLFVDAEILLVAEEHHASSSDESRKVVLLAVGEVRQIDAVNLSANLRVVVEHVCCVGKQVPEAWIPQLAFIDVRNLFIRGPRNLWELWPQIFEIVCISILLDRCSPGNVLRNSTIRLLCGFCCWGSLVLDSRFHESWSHYNGVACICVVEEWIGRPLS
jgi:hypothetical protein